MLTPQTVEMLYADEHVNILLLENTYRRAVELQWRNHCCGEVLEQVSAKAVELARRHYVTSWIANDQELGPLTEADLLWAERTLLAMHQDFGFDRMAMLRSPLEPNQKLLAPILAKYTPLHAPIVVRLFTNAAQARNWALSL